MAALNRGGWLRLGPAGYVSARLPASRPGCRVLSQAGYVSARLPYVSARLPTLEVVLLVSETTRGFANQQHNL